MSNLFRWFYHRWFWVQDWTSDSDVSIWFDKQNRVLPSDYGNGPCSNTANPKNWKEAEAVLQDMKANGSRRATVMVFVSWFGKRRYDLESFFEVNPDTNEWEPSDEWWEKKETYRRPTMDKLRECPFECGAEVTINKHFKHDFWRLTHRCRKMATVSTEWTEDKQKLIDEWNHRPTEDALRARVAELEERENQFWEMVQNSFEIETREELEEEAKGWSHKNAMECAVHAMWKRDPQVAELQKRVGELEEERADLKEQIYVHSGFTPRLFTCQKCGHYYAQGYCCSFCGDGDPMDKALTPPATEEEEE